MLTKPALADEAILACLQAQYHLPVESLAFLPLGADLNTAVYRAVAPGGSAYFVKLRSGPFDETSVALPRHLYAQGAPAIIPPLPAQTGKLWAALGDFKLILYPYIEGRNGYEIRLSDRHWIEFGAALRRIHSLPIPAEIASQVQAETYPPAGRRSVRQALLRAEQDAGDDPLAQELVACLRTQRALILELVARAEQCAQALQAQPPESIVCHSDLHAGNVLIAADGTFYLVDWDNPILAAKERDLMFAGGGQFGAARTPQEEEALFYQGYGAAQINPIALAYYRCERIVQDIAIFCEQVFSVHGSEPDRQQALRYLASNFIPGGVIEIALKP